MLNVLNVALPVCPLCVPSLCVRVPSLVSRSLHTLHACFASNCPHFEPFHRLLALTPKYSTEHGPPKDAHEPEATRPTEKLPLGGPSEENTGGSVAARRRPALARRCLKANPSSRASSRFSGRFGVFALGSSAYPNFCAYGKYLDTVLAELGGERVSRLGIGDELCGQEQSFNDWATQIFGQACDVFCLTDELDMTEVMKRATLKPMLWSKENVRLEENATAAVETEQLKETIKTKRVEQG